MNYKEFSSDSFLITINNPTTKGLTYDKIIPKLILLGEIKYCCMCEEVSCSGTHHIHVYVEFKNELESVSVRGFFTNCHIDISSGTTEQNRAYIGKFGKRWNYQGSDVNLINTFLEFGEYKRKFSLLNVFRR